MMFMAILPDVFGVGLIAFSSINEDDAKRKVREEYYELYCERNQSVKNAENWLDDYFKYRWNRYGGRTFKIDENKVYNESF